MNARQFVSKISATAGKYPDEIFNTPGRVYTCVNPFSYGMVRSGAGVYEELDGLFVDGMTMCWWIRLLYGAKVPRLSFDMAGMAVDLFAKLNASGENGNIYFIGAREDTIGETMGIISKAYPGMQIAGWRHGYFRDSAERRETIEKIVALNPDFTIIGMGSPLQEQFAADLKRAGYKGVAFTCGGFLHQTSSRMNYYPEWVNKYNLRAFYRLIKEKGLAKRLWQVLAGFPLQFVYDTITRREFKS